MSDKDVPQRRSPYLRPRPPGARLARGTIVWLLGASVLVLALISLVGENGLGEYLRLRAERDRLQRDLDAITAEAATLQANLDALQHDPLALEKLARERYNMRRAGEEVILLIPEADQTPSHP